MKAEIIRTDKNKNSAVSFLELASAGRVDQAYQELAAEESGITTHFSRARQSLFGPR